MGLPLSLAMPELKYKIEIAPDLHLLSDETKLKQFLEATLCDKDAERSGLYNDLKQALTVYHKTDGAPVLNKYEIAGCAFDGVACTGKIKFRYEVAFTFGCADIHRTDEYTETCKFIVDTDNKQLVLFLTDFIQRDTVDEF